MITIVVASIINKSITEITNSFDFKVFSKENLNKIEINDTHIEEIKPVKEVPRPPRESFPEPIEEPIQKEEPPRKSRRIYLGDYVSEDKRQHVTIRDSENLREDNLNLYI